MSIELDRLHDKAYRMSNLYRIVDRNGNDIDFHLNPVQQDVLDHLHTRNIILKARQLGMSTFAVLYLLDEALFNFNLSCGIVSYSLQHAQHIFRRIIGHALDNMPKEVRPLGIINRSAHEISFNNGSFLRVDTTLRGGTCQHVLISEFGKTCARSPAKAQEIVTGTLNTIGQDGVVIIESTGEGNDGYFADMVQSAALRGNESLGKLEYRLFFYPWFMENSYATSDPVACDTVQSDYFKKLEQESGRIIAKDQRNWYLHQQKFLGDKIKQEYPSTVSEAFLSCSDAYYYASSVAKAFEDNRCVHTSIYDALLPVFVAMDIGINDLTVIVFFQLCHGEIRVIDFYEDKNKGVDFYARLMLQDKRYVYHTIFLPHDAARRDGIIVENTYEREFRKLFAQTNTKFQVLPRTDLNLGISHAKIKFDRCVFNINKVKPLVDHLSKYRKKWSEPHGRYLDEPYHDVHSNYADAFRYLCQAVTSIEALGDQSGALAKHRAAVEARRKII